MEEMEMHKLRLQIEELAVESFEVACPATPVGTVRGMDGETAGCDSIRICGPTDPSDLPCGDTYSPCGDTSDQTCTASAGFTACTCVGTTGC